jgi:tetratricopeptide (TPR) repeat protein
VMLEAYARTDGALALGLGREGLRDFPDDGPLLLAMGTLEESLASPGGPGLLDGRDTDRGLLEAAAKNLEAAARAGDDPAEALVRLGRVQVLLGRGEAEKTLADALGRTSDPRLVCLACLFHGGLEENAGRLESATREYRRAIEAVPAAEVPRVALSHVLRRQGKIRAAHDALRAALRWPPRSDDADPWWVYPWGHAREADSLLAQLREDAR